MELISDEKKEKENKGRKIIIGALILSVILIILVLILILVLEQKENDKIKLIVDGEKKTFNEELMVTDPNSNISYFSISQVANLVGYNYFNGEYKKYSEDKTKCYVESKNEIAMFELKSDVIYKNNPVNKLNFDEYKIDKPIESSNNILYATASTIQTAFNTKITYDEKTNTISLYTLPYLNEYYKEAVKKYGYDGISEEFANGKTLTKDMLVVNKDNKYGVISTNNLETIIGNKYDKMIYLESTREFIVTSDGKCGILSTDGETKIGLRYEDVGLIDGKLGLYYTKNNNLYGVVNSKGKMLTYNEFEDIGVDRNTFSLGDMKSNYILYNNCIPLKKDGKWGLVDKLGTVILNFDYDSLGYIEEETDLYYNTTPTPVQTGTANEININNVATIPSIEGIVFGINGKYGVVNAIGNLIIPFKCDKIFSATNEGGDEYFLERSGMTVSLKKYLELNKINVEEIYQSIVKTEN